MVRPAELLATWEAGYAAGDGRRALLLHAWARPDSSADRLLDMPIGDRDADLMRLRAVLFGPHVPMLLACARCGEELEFQLPVAELAGAEASSGSSAAEAPTPKQAGASAYTSTIRGFDLDWRLPSVADVLAATDAAALPDADADAARRTLLTRCVLRARRGGRAKDPASLPADVQAGLAEAMAAADPRADLLLDVPCPICGFATKAVLDIASCLWAEVDAWARATLLEVHLLASAYGWTEPDVLALSPVRRRYYLELAGHG